MLLYTYENLKPLVKTELGQKLIEETRKIYEKEFGGKPVPATDYSTFKRIYQTGDRDGYFRDYLIEHSDVAKEYEDLKLNLWKKYEHNRDAYTNAKTEFVKKYTEKAKVLYGNRY